MMLNKKVSIIIRTHQRPSLLKQALESLENQTIKSNIEAIVVEDGPAISKAIIELFPDLDIRYIATEKHVGRVRAGNIGLENSSGCYVNFLDDDDLFLPQHVECMLRGFDKHKDAIAIHTGAIERTIEFLSYNPLQYKILREYKKYNEPFSKDIILHKNMFPIQSVMFKRDLYEEYGGMDESFELLEDWDLWIKYSLHGPFYFINEYTSVYHIPADRSISLKRTEELIQYEKILKEKYREYIINSTYNEESIVKKFIKHYKTNGLKKTTQKIFDLLRK